MHFFNPDLVQPLFFLRYYTVSAIGQKTGRYMKNLKEKVILVTIFFSVLLVVFETLSPFDFTRDAGPPGWHLPIVGFGETGVSDILLNILLFMPFGFSLSIYLTHKRKVPGQSPLLWVFILSVVLSYAVETMQIFLPKRFPSLFDVSTNSLGGISGFFLLKLLQHRYRVSLSRLSVQCICLIEAVSNYLEKKVAIMVPVYLVWIVVVTLSFQRCVHLQNWSFGFPLLIGNEHTGDRPWQGSVSAVLLYDRAL